MEITKTFLFTTSWDDGAPEDLRLAELLDRYDLPATFYVPRSGQRSVLDATDVRRLSQRFEIGGHTLNHVVLTRTTDTRAREEIAGCKNWLEDVIGRPCRMFCFPAGKFRRSHLHQVRDAGFWGARTVELLSLAAPTSCAGIALVPTTAQVFSHSSGAYIRNIVKRHSMIDLLAYASVRGGEWHDFARRLLFRAMKRGGVFHLWGHSWEVDQYQLWDQLAAFLQLVQSCRIRDTYVTNSSLCSDIVRF